VSTYTKLMYIWGVIISSPYSILYSSLMAHTSIRFVLLHILLIPSHSTDTLPQ